MDLTQISPDEVVYWQWGWLKLNATIVYTWATMLLIVGGSWLVTRKLRSDQTVSRWQNLLEIVVDFLRNQIRNIAGHQPSRYLPFIGTLLLLIGTCNALTIVPGYIPPTASLSTTAGLAICVFFAVPAFGIARQGVKAFLKHYVSPHPLMLPFHVIGELSRTLALAVRLFGNIMSGTKIVAILVALAPLIFPVFMRALGLLTGMIQAYIFAVLAMVYITSGTEAYQNEQQKSSVTHQGNEPGQSQSGRSHENG